MVFTGTRADFGLLRPVLEAMDATDALEIFLIAGGTHFSAAYGRTIDEILEHRERVTRRRDHVRID